MTTLASISRSRWLWIIFAAALLVRFLNVADIARQPELALTDDATLYWHGARDWIESGGFNRATGESNGVSTFTPEHERVAGYFLFLVPFFALFDGNPIPVLIAQSLLDALSCLLIAGIGFRISRETGLLAGFLAALWPNMIIHSGLVLTETLFLFLTVLLVICALRFADRLKLADAGLTGLLCGSTIIVRPAMQFFPLALVLAAAILPFLHRKDWRIALLAPFLVVVGVAAPITPHLVRNLDVLGEMRLTSQTGVHLLYWVASQVDQIGTDASFDELAARYQAELEARFAARNQSFVAAPAFAQDREMQALALEILADQPVTAIAQAWMQGIVINLMAPAILGDPRIRALKTESFMGSTGGDIFSRARHVVASAPPAYLAAVALGGVGSVLTLVLAVAGLIVMLRRDVALACLSAALVGYFLLLTGPVAAPKYRIPFEPVLILACAAALAAALERWRDARASTPQPEPPDRPASGTE